MFIMSGDLTKREAERERECAGMWWERERERTWGCDVGERKLNKKITKNV